MKNYIVLPICIIIALGSIFYAHLLNQRSQSLISSVDKKIDLLADALGYIYEERIENVVPEHYKKNELINSEIVAVPDRLYRSTFIGSGWN